MEEKWKGKKLEVTTEQHNKNIRVIYMNENKNKWALKLGNKQRESEGC